MSDDLVKRLRNTPNWMREEYGHYKDGLKVYDRAPFEAADALDAQAAEIARLRALCDRQSTALSLSGMRHGRILVGLERRNARQRRALAKLYQRRHDKNAALATARREGMEEAAQRAFEYARTAWQHGSLPVDPHECAAQTAREIASSIEAIIYSSVKDEPWRRACDQCGVSLPANCPADEGYGCPACETHKERDEDAIRAAARSQP